MVGWYPPLRRGPHSATVIDVRVGGNIPGDPGVTGSFWRLGALRLSISSTILIFVIVPAAAVALIVALSMAGSSRRRARRYRPGRPYDFTPIWYLASPAQVSPPAIEGPGSGGRSQAPAITSGAVETSGRVRAGATGGASDRW